MDTHSVKVVLGDEAVGLLPREFSGIASYFPALSGEIRVKGSVAYDIVSSFAEEWRFHYSYSLPAQTNCK